MVQANLKRRSSNTCFLLVFLFLKKGNLQSRVCNCDFNCSSVSIFPSASLVTLIPLSLSHPCTIPHANSLVSSVLSALLSRLFIPSTASVLVWSSAQQLSNLTARVCLLSSQHLSPCRPPSTATRLNQESDLSTGSLDLGRMRNRSRKVSSSLSLHSPFPRFSSLQPLNRLMSACSVTTHSQSHLDSRRRQGLWSCNFTTVVCTLQKGTVARGRQQLELLTDSSGEALWKPGNS